MDRGRARDDRRPLADGPLRPRPRHLGLFNGAYTAGRPVPDAAFLTTAYLRSWTNWLPWIDAVRSPACWSDPMVARAIPDLSLGRLERLHAAAPKLFDRLDRLPQALSHLDAWRTNLIGSRAPNGAERTIAIEWSSVGRAPLGQEIAILVGGSHIWLDADPELLSTMSARVFAGYVDGLRDAGWRGDERAVRCAYAASAALYMAPPLPLWLRTQRRPRAARMGRAKVRSSRGRDRPWLALLLEHVLALSDEAYALDAK